MNAGGKLNDAAPQRVIASFEAADDLLWQAVASRLPKLGPIRLARSGRIGPLALGELQDNVFEHSGRPESGVVAYAASNGAFEFVVADAGRGVLASLRENPEFAGLADSGAALRVAVLTGRRGTRAAQATAMVSDSCFAHSLMMPPS